MKTAEADQLPLTDVKIGTLQINGITSRENGSWDSVKYMHRINRKIEVAAASISRAIKQNNMALGREIKSLCHLNVKLQQKKNILK